MKKTGVLHLHSRYSYDGALSLSELKQLLQSRGISVAFMTEHTDVFSKEKGEAFIRECAALSDESFIFVPGVEVPYGSAHILMIGIRSFVIEGQATADMLRKWKSASRLAILAHPHRNNYIIDDAMRGTVDGVEIWNAQYDGKFTPRFASLRLLKSLAAREKPLLATAGMDFHRPEHLGMPQMVFDIEMFDSSSMLEAFAQGNYTIGGGGFSVTPRGDIRGARVSSLRVKSFILIRILSVLKFLSKMFATLGIRVPKNIRRRFRSRI